MFWAAHQKKWNEMKWNQINHIKPSQVKAIQSIELIKSKINLTSKEINTSEAEKIIAEFNKTDVDSDKARSSSSTKNKTKSKKISKT